MIIKINGAFPTLNEYIRVERGNRYASAKMKKENTQLVAIQARKYNKVKGKVDLHFEWHTTKRADHDNICFARKFILDGLVKGGVLANDNPKHVGNFKDDFVKDKQDYCLIRVIEAE